MTSNAGHSLLVFKIKNFCYDSSFYFADRVAFYFKNMGWKVDVFDSSKEPLTALDKYSGRHYDAIIDFNSLLPKADTDEGSYYLDTIDAPFYNYILDHPIFHHELLSKPLRHHNVICPDLNHKAYLDKWYPNLEHTYFLPVAGSRADKYAGTCSPEDYAKRPFDLLFMGTYTDPNALYDIVMNFDGSYRKEMLYIIERMLADPLLTMEKTLDELLKEKGIDEQSVSYPLRMQTYFPADMYIRAKIREDMLTALADTDLEITIAGHGWNVCPALRKKKNVKILPPVPFKDSFEYMTRAKIGINSNPLFNAGCHDRVFSAMLNGAVAFTESSSYIEKEFDTGSDLITYDRRDKESIKEKAVSALSDTDRLYEMALNGSRKAACHDWEHHCRTLSESFISHMKTALCGGEVLRKF